MESLSHPTASGTISFQTQGLINEILDLLVGGSQVLLGTPHPDLAVPWLSHADAELIRAVRVRPQAQHKYWLPEEKFPMDGPLPKPEAQRAARKIQGPQPWVCSYHMWDHRDVPAGL